MITSFGDAATEDVFHGRGGARVRKRPADVMAAAQRNLDIINAAADLNDLRAPPGNLLEKLKGSLAGQWSVRVNDPWRLLFKWQGNNAHGVRLLDYH